jgi:UDP-N-acetylmuramoyl-tripeptide--D-alanyl-D-alanine ligase
MTIKIIFLFFWIFSFNRKFLFWLYLWQLKEYHFGRFFDHFRTEKGKRIFLNGLIFLKVLIIVCSVLFVKVFYLAFLIFFLEFLFFFKKILKKGLKIPSFTQKIILIFVSGLTFQTFLVLLFFKEPLLNVIFFFLLLDILVPLFSSLIVFLWHPFSCLWRIIIIKKSKKKIEKMNNLLTIGITGSYGKTSTKEFLSTILSSKYNVLKTKKNHNSEVGISRCILEELNQDHEIFVCEMGAYNKGEIKLLCEIAQPKMGILTGINQQHMATFGSQENITKTKFELINYLPEEGTAILNKDSEEIKKEYNKRKFKVKKRIFYSIREEADFFAKNIISEENKVSFNVFSDKEKFEKFEVQVPGLFNVSNILASVAVAKELGMNLEEINEASNKINANQSGMKLKKNKGGMNIIDATYSSNPNGILSHLSYLEGLEGKKAIIMPCLIELGESSKEIHKKIGRRIGKVCDLAIIITKENFEELKEGINDNLEKKTEVVFLEDYDSILKKVKDFSSDQNNLLLENRIPNKIIKGILDL